MGCSPPDWWYDQQHRASIEQRRIEHQQEVKKLLNLIDDMTDDQKKELKNKLGL